MIIDHTHKLYNLRLAVSKANRYNGAFYYSQEIVQNIIPNVETDRNWITINHYNVPHIDHAILFVHNNKNLDKYVWLRDCTDMVLVCGIEETAKRMKNLGKTIYLPLSVDVGYVSQFKRKKDRDIAYVGRPSKKKYDGVVLPKNLDLIENLPRNKLLQEMARYKKVYAVGRCAIEAKVLGCEVLPYDPRFPNPDMWQVLDSKDAAMMLQEKLNKIEEV